jgi:transposase
MDVDECDCGGSRKGKRGRGAAGKVRVLGLLKRGGKVHVVIIPNARQNTLIPIIGKTIEPDSIVYTDDFLSYDAPDVSGFRHHRINHSQRCVEARNPINGIENFRNQAKPHLRRFSYRPTARLYKTPLAWAKPEII